MKSKLIDILYWTLTILFALFMLEDGTAKIVGVQQGVDILKHLGYPAYLLTIMGIAQVIGCVCIVQPFFRVLKEWAYAGFCINFLGAGASHYFLHDPIITIISPIIFLIVLFITYFLWKKYEDVKMVK